jgi:hypothetical protein
MEPACLRCDVGERCANLDDVSVGNSAAGKQMQTAFGIRKKKADAWCRGFDAMFSSAHVNDSSALLKAELARIFRFDS